MTVWSTLWQRFDFLIILAVIVWFHLVSSFINFIIFCGDFMATAEHWVSVDEVCLHLAVNKDSIYRWVETKNFAQ